MTPELSNLMQQRDYQHRKALKSNLDSSYHWQKYRRLRNQSNQAFKVLKARYFTDLIDNAKGRASDMWRALKKIFPAKSNRDGTTLSALMSDGVLITNPTEIAECLNRFFTNIGQELAKRFNSFCNSVIVNESSPECPPFHLKYLTEDYVRSQIKCLKTNKAIGLDSLSTKMLKDSVEVITPVITKLCNLSIKVAKFPSLWKCAKVAALFKSGDRTNASNYRPISILPTISKIIERAVHDQLYSHLTENDLINAHQFGFRPRSSTTVALATFTDQVLSNMDDGKVTGAVFLDLAKAFDTVDHVLLFQKLQCLGVSGLSLDWLRSYLSQRSQVTAIGKHVSTSMPINIGVPQGSILGPLLFIVYINDLLNCLEHTNVTLYADDTVIYCDAVSPLDLQSKLHKDLDNVVTWFTHNKLTVNTTKTKFMLIGSSQKLKSFSGLQLSIYDEEIEGVEDFKYLGVTLNRNLTWHEHIASIESKVKQKLGFLNRIKCNLPTHARITFYNTLIKPIFDYANLIWGDKRNIVLMDSLQVLQNRAAKIILDRDYFASASDALNELRWKPLSTYRTQDRCLFVFKCLNGLVDFNMNIHAGSSIHKYNTRNKSIFRKPTCHTNWGMLRTNYHCVQDYNKLSCDVKNITNINTFKQVLRDSF